MSTVAPEGYTKSYSGRQRSRSSSYPASNSSAERSSSPSASKLDRILVVDDIADNYILLQTLLQAEGYQVDIADNGYAALQQIESQPPDLILLDVMMPEMNGYEVTQRIRQNQQLPYIPILLVTGHDKPSAGDGFDAGADGFIRKPIDFDELLQRIASILAPAE